MKTENAERMLPRRDVLKSLGAITSSFLLSPLSLASLISGHAARTHLHFCCSPQNDLYRILSSGGISSSRADTAHDAVAGAPEGSGVLLLADEYPAHTLEMDPKLYQQAAGKKLRLYVEFPSALPGLDTGEPQHVAWGKIRNVLDRAVVTSDVYAPSLEPLRILALHNCWYVPVAASNAALVLARVAGFDTAVYGLPPNETHPLLFQLPDHDILVSTTKLSGFITGRYAPAEACEDVWRWILAWLSGRNFPFPRWTPNVRPVFARDQQLPRGAELAAFRKGIDWFSQAKLFVAPSWKHKVLEYADAPDPDLGPSASWPLGDGSEGVLEGFSGAIQWNGKQPVGWSLRADCAGEVSMAMALSGLLERKPENSRIASNLNDFIYSGSALTSGPREDPKSASFGLMGWSVPGSLGTYYGDDNARSLLGTMATAGLLPSDRWNKKVLRCLLANLRTTGPLGFRHRVLTESQLQASGWKHFYDERYVAYHPHFQAYPWACFLRAYQTTHYTPFLERAETAIEMTMAAYPNQWRWTNGLQQERARMLLPLAWLVRLRDTEKSRGWLKRIATDLLEAQDASGAIREQIGSVGEGQYGPPKSNDKYGTAEAPLLQENGDPVCDLLYTANFAFLGLHEAATATQESLYREGERKLADFLCRIQIQSAQHPELAGGWFRAFDFSRWDYWGSASDWGWGPWSIETGWTQSWICAVLAMRTLNISLWELTGKADLRPHLNELLPIMFS